MDKRIYMDNVATLDMIVQGAHQASAEIMFYQHVPGMLRSRLWAVMLVLWSLRMP